MISFRMEGAVGALLLALLIGLALPAHAADNGQRFAARADLATSTTAAKLHDANGARVALVCTNEDGTNNVKLGDVTNKPTASRGVLLKAGVSITITSRAEIWVIAAAGTPTISCTEEF